MPFGYQCSTKPGSDQLDVPTTIATRRLWRNRERIEEGARAALPALEKPSCESRVESEQCPDAEEDVVRQRRLADRQGLRHVVEGDVLVDRIGFHVLLEEVEGVVTESEPPKPSRIARVRDRRRGLERSEMPDDRPTEAAVEPAHRHQVHGGERGRRDPVEVRAVGWIEVESAHRP